MMLLRIAGALQLGVAAANLPLARILKFGAEQRRLTPIVRQIQQIHHIYIVGILAAFGVLSLAFPGELSDGRPLGRFLSVLLAVFWGGRLIVQRLYYDPSFLRQHRSGDALFSLIFVFLFLLYAASAAGVLR